MCLAKNENEPLKDGIFAPRQHAYNNDEQKEFERCAGHSLLSRRNMEIVNRKAKFEYHFVQSYEAGIALQGTEVKSVRQGHANMNDAYCHFRDNELFIKSLFIAEYDHGNIHNHESRRDRKLLLNKSELRKLRRRVDEKGLTIIPYRIYFNERGLVKLEIVLAQGKQAHDKRQSIKERESKRELDRIKKSFR